MVAQIMNPFLHIIKRGLRTLLQLLIIAIVLVAAFALFGGKHNDEMRVWHTEMLEEEFTREKQDSIQTFGDYLRLEDQLFQELSEKIIAQVETGSGFELSRYSAKSLADPLSMEINWNRSFELANNEPVGGVLLLHGMSDSPYSLRAIGQRLHEYGYWVIGLRLPGHGTAPSGLRTVHWHEMGAAVKLAVDHLQVKTAQKPLHLIGYSTGASIALDFALDALQENKDIPASLVLISPAIGIAPAAGLAGIKDWFSRLPGLDHLGWLSVEPEFDPFKYNSFSTNAANQVHLVTRDVASRVKQWSKDNTGSTFPPLLVFKSTVDATVSVDAVVTQLLLPLNSSRHELILFDINRFTSKDLLITNDPGPLTKRLLEDDSLPFEFTVISNETPSSTSVVARKKALHSVEMRETENLEMSWPTGVISLSHVALPFPPDDPLYGSQPQPDKQELFLGQMEIKGERGLLKIPYDWLLRLRHNPFYDYLERRTIDWLEDNGKQ